MSGIENYQKLLTDCKIHLKQALLNVMHNEIGDPTVTRIPSDPEELYNYLKGKKKKIEGNLNANQKAILFPTDTQRVDSQKFDVTLTRLLIREFCDIKNAKGNKGEPDDNDTTLWAYVYRAAVMRNEIFHEGNIIEYDEETYTDLWGKMKNILDGLKYKGDTRVFLQHLKDYKDYSSENTSEEFHIERYFSVKEDKNKPMYIYEQEVWSTVLKEKDRVIIHGEAGIGKTETARKIKRDWSVGNILFGYHLLYFKSKTMNQQITYRCCEAPYFFSEMGEGRGKSYENLLYYDCVTRPIWNLFILVDGVDEFPIKNLLIKEDVDKLETKVSNNEKITAAETIYAIYYGFLFPNAKICLLGRNGEFQRLKEVEDERENSIFNTSKRETADLMLLKFNEENIKDFTCFKICNGKHTGACQEIYEKLKNIDLCKVPTNLNSYFKLPNKDIGRITRTKILIATLHNRLNKHISKRMNKTSKSFREIREERIFKEYLECIRALAEMSFNALLKGVVTVEVVTGESGYLEDIHNHIKVKRTCLEELDFFYIRDDVCDFKLEPYHTLNIEFLSACYLFSQPAKWNLISKLKLDNEAVIIAFIAGLHAGDRSTSDFVRNVFNTSDYSLAKFFDWLYDKRCWNGSYNFLMPNQQMSPPIYILEKISHEVEIPQTLISSTIIAYSLFDPNLYNFRYVFKHSFFTKVSDNLDLDSFLDRFPKYNFIITIEQAKMDEENFRFIKKYKENNRVSFRTFQMRFKEAFKSLFDLELSLHGIRVEKNLDSSSNTKLLSSLSSPSPNIKCNIYHGHHKIQ